MEEIAIDVITGVTHTELDTPTKELIGRRVALNEQFGNGQWRVKIAAYLPAGVKGNKFDEFTVVDTLTKVVGTLVYYRYHATQRPEGGIGSIGGCVAAYLMPEL